MTWARRPAEETPRAEQRTVVDDRGRHWTGTVRSGSQRRGEEHAEVLFVCEDQPSERKRIARLRIPAAEVDDRWRAMDENDVREVFRRSMSG
jgi:hypothetical protein